MTTRCVVPDAVETHRDLEVELRSVTHTSRCSHGSRNASGRVLSFCSQNVGNLGHPEPSIFGIMCTVGVIAHSSTGPGGHDAITVREWEPPTEEKGVSRAESQSFGAGRICTSLADNGDPESGSRHIGGVCRT